MATSSSSDDSVARVLAGPLSGFWARGRGPSEEQVAAIISRFHVDPRQLGYRNKQGLVRLGVLAAPSDRTTALIDELVQLLRAERILDLDSELVDIAVSHFSDALLEVGAEFDTVRNSVNWPDELAPTKFRRPAKPPVMFGTPRLPTAVPPLAAPTPATAKGTDPIPMTTGTIFLVHGHDTAFRNEVENQLHRWKLEPQTEIVVLDREPNRGATLIEKFEKHASEAKFVIVMAMPDDVGRARNSTTEEARARQNVIFELGYFIARLGRENVVVMDGGITQPSDIVGVTYIGTSWPDWAKRLGAELEAAKMAGSWLR